MTVKQKKFAEEYVQNGYKANPAYQVAYNSTWENANKSAYKVLKDPEVKAYIRELEKGVYDRLAINAEHIAQELADMAFAAVDNEKGLTYAVKQKAIDLLQKQLNLQNTKVDISTSTGIQINITGDKGDEQ